MWIVKPSLILSPAFCLYIGPSLLLLSHSITCLPHLSTHLSVDTHLFCLPALPCTLNHISELVMSTHLHNCNLLYFSCPCTYIQLPAFRLELDFLDQNMSHLLTSQPLCETKKKHESTLSLYSPVFMIMYLYVCPIQSASCLLFPSSKRSRLVYSYIDTVGWSSVTSIVKSVRRTTSLTLTSYAVTWVIYKHNLSVLWAGNCSRNTCIKVILVPGRRGVFGLVSFALNLFSIYHF